MHAITVKLPCDLNDGDLRATMRTLHGARNTPFSFSALPKVNNKGPAEVRMKFHYGESAGNSPYGRWKGEATLVRNGAWVIGTFPDKKGTLRAFLKSRSGTSSEAPILDWLSNKFTKPAAAHKAATQREELAEATM